MGTWIYMGILAASDRYSWLTGWARRQKALTPESCLVYAKDPIQADFFLSLQKVPRPLPVPCLPQNRGCHWGRVIHGTPTCLIPRGASHRSQAAGVS